MGEHIMGFACGIAVYHLINYLKKVKDDKFRTGEEEPCNNCYYKSTVIDMLRVTNEVTDENE